MLTIGLVAEGPHDFIMLKPIIADLLKRRTSSQLDFRELQPIQDETGSHTGGGWSRVMAWCKDHSGERTRTFFTPLFSNQRPCDIIVIHLDGDALELVKPHTDIEIPETIIEVDLRLHLLKAITKEWLTSPPKIEERTAFAFPVLHSES